MADQPQPQLRSGSPLWWLVTLENRLMQRQTAMKTLDKWYRGEHPLPFLTQAHNAKMSNEFGKLLDESKSNFMRLVVDATEERLAVEGFRLSAETDPLSDRDSWAIWQANQMDAQSSTAVLEALVKGVAYLSVWSDQDRDGHADIAVEDPLQTIVAYQPGSNYRRRAAALKVWLDDVRGTRRADVYMPSGVFKFEAPAEEFQSREPTTDDKIRIPWNPLPMDENFARNPTGVVPIIPLRNRGRLLVEGESEISDVTAIQSQINGFIFLQALAGYFGAHRQRWAVGLKIMVDDAGRPVEPFDTAIDRLWQTENPEAKFGEFTQTDLDGYIKSIEQKVLHIATTSRTPRHYLFQEGQSPSGDAIQSAESGLVKKVERKQTAFGEGLEEAIRLARRFEGLGDAPPDSEIVWRDARTVNSAVTTDAVVKQHQEGLIDHATALAELGYSQTQIRQIMALKESNPEMFAEPAPAAGTPALDAPLPADA
jgi:hypothetical protein